MAEHFSLQSPYLYAANNPVRFIDYKGMFAAQNGLLGLTLDDLLERIARLRDRLNTSRRLKNEAASDDNQNRDLPPPCPGCKDLPVVVVEADRNVSSWVDEAAYWTQWVPVLGAGFSSASKTRKGDYWGAAGDFGIAMAEMFTLGYASKYTMPARAAANQAAKQSTKVVNLADDIAEWLGKGARRIVNKNGDLVFISKNGTRRVRFDIKNPKPHKNPHSHVEELINGKWQKSGPLYPKDVPNF